MNRQQQLLFKQTVFNHCKKLLEDRIMNAQLAMTSAQESANNEDKSSAGDKYETSRAMGQLARDMNAKQLAEAQSELSALMKLNIEYLSDKVIAGSMIETTNGIYVITAGIGKIIVNEETVIVLSPKAPLALAMTGKKKNESFLFNGKPTTIKQIV